MKVDGRERHGLVHVPPGLRDRVPAVIMLHGAGATAKLALDSTGWTATADRKGFLAVFPEAARPDPRRPAHFLRNPPLWNDGYGKGQMAKMNVDDVGFIRLLLDRLVARFPVDERRIHVTGFSNGGSMALRLGVELADRIASVAAVSGYLWIRDPRPARPVSLMYLLGELDPLTPPKGGTVRLEPWGITITYPSLEDAMLQWARLAGCPGRPKIEESDGITVRRYGPAPNGVEVLVYLIAGMGHAWPGGKPVLHEKIAGPPSNRLKANDVIFDFFSRHPMPAFRGAPVSRAAPTS